jgi:hypothetical protein
MTISTLGLLLAVTLPTGWKIAPVGVRMDLDTFPIHAQRLGDGKRALVLHSGFRPPSIELLDVATGARSGTLKLKEAGLNFAFDEASGEIFVPGGHESKMYLLRLEGSRIVEAGSVALNDPVGPVSSVAMSAMSVAITQTTQNRVGVYDRASRGLKYLSVPRPMRASFHEGLLYVLSHQPAALHVFSAELREIAKVPLSEGPADLLVHAGKLFVTASSTNYLDVLDVQVASAPKRVERINLAGQAVCDMFGRKCGGSAECGERKGGRVSANRLVSNVCATAGARECADSKRQGREIVSQPEGAEPYRAPDNDAAAAFRYRVHAFDSNRNSAANRQCGEAICKDRGAAGCTAAGVTTKADRTCDLHHEREPHL